MLSARRRAEEYKLNAFLAKSHAGRAQKRVQTRIPLRWRSAVRNLRISCASRHMAVGIRNVRVFFFLRGAAAVHA
eukprot:11194177-Lingulodinium_polyedra.AAC.1